MDWHLWFNFDAVWFFYFCLQEILYGCALAHGDWLICCNSNVESVVGYNMFNPSKSHLSADNETGGN